MDLEFGPVKLWGFLLATIVVTIIILCSNFSCKNKELWVEPNYRIPTLKEENMESMKANYKIPTLKRRTWKHKSKLQNCNLKEESTGSTGIIIYHSMISAKLQSSTDHELEILKFEIQLSSRLPKVICTISLAYTSPNHLTSSTTSRPQHQIY
jgi:uncharacterized membrane protein YhiD involved in acid resistance